MREVEDKHEEEGDEGGAKAFPSTSVIEPEARR